MTNPCSNVTCPDGQFCKNGNCEKTCAGVSCPAGQYCRAGRCIGNTCAAVKCQSGQVCSNGQCLKDPCGGVSCRSGQICSQGQCVDNPCSVTRCPVGQVCRLPSGDCFGPNQDPNNNKTSPADEFAQPEGPTTPGFGEDGGSVVGPTTGDKDIQNNANSSNPGGRRGGGACLCAASPGALGATSWGLIGLVFLILIGLRRRH